MLRSLCFVCLCFALSGPAEASRRITARGPGLTGKPVVSPIVPNRQIVLQTSDARRPAAPAVVRAALLARKVKIIDSATKMFLVQGTRAKIERIVQPLAGWRVLPELQAQTMSQKPLPKP